MKTRIKGQSGSAALALAGVLLLGGIAYAGMAQPPEGNALQRMTQAWAQDAGSVRIALAAPQTDLVIGVDDLRLELTSERPGYLTLLAAGSDGTTLHSLLPNNPQTPLKVVVGKTSLPPPGLALSASGPEGIGAVMAIVSDTPLDANALLAQLRERGTLHIDAPHGVSVMLYRERAQR